MCGKSCATRSPSSGGGKLLADGDIETVKGNESLEEVFLELVDDIKVEEDAAQEGEKHA